MQEVTGSSPVPSTPRKPLTKVRGFFVASATVSRQSRTVQDSNRAAARSAVSNQPSATTTTAASGRNREELLGQRSDFSKPRQGAAEKSANATRCCCLARGSQSSGMSTKKAPPAEAPFAEPRFVQYRTGTMYVRAIRKKQRQGIIVAMVSCLLCYMTRLGAIAARRLSSRIWYCSFFWEYGILGSINRIYKGESR